VARVHATQIVEWVTHRALYNVSSHKTRNLSLGERRTDSGSQWVVAIVDDDPAVCNSTRFLLKAHDFDVQTYQSGANFLNEKPDIACMIVDYDMPGLDGFELVSELRKRGSQVPIRSERLPGPLSGRAAGARRCQAQGTRASGESSRVSAAPREPDGGAERKPRERDALGLGQQQFSAQLELLHGLS